MLRCPTIEQLRAIATDHGLHMSEAELESFRRLVAQSLESYRRVDRLVDPVPPIAYPRAPGYRPRPEDNPYNAWYWKCSIKGAPEGLLRGKRVAIKDNVCVAGVPMMNGSSILEGYVPEVDATIVTRILDAGGEIVGKSTCENLCFSGSSFTSDTGPVPNPHDPSRSVGGSSTGSAVLLVMDECDMAIGGDQGGSIAHPCAWTGVYGLKPTYGLVPYTGIFPIEHTLDHIGPMAATVADVALLLEVLAGSDGLDPRQRDVRTEKYTAALSRDVRGLRIGVLEEGFGWPNRSESDVDDAVRAAAATFAGLGATVRSVSVPMHRDGFDIWNCIAIEGAAALMVDGNAMGTNWKGQYNVSLLEAFARGRLCEADSLPETVKFVMLMARHMRQQYHGRYYAKAQNLGRVLTRAYEEAFRDVDLLLLPTLPMKAIPLPVEPELTPEEFLMSGLGINHNTCPFNVTGHPALTIPCAKSAGLPIGMTLVGPAWAESKLLRAGHAFEQTGAYTVHLSR
ncbi:MAG TPA: amidase [bacterium]|nr:amidase [bacterium]